MCLRPCCLIGTNQGLSNGTQRLDLAVRHTNCVSAVPEGGGDDNLEIARLVRYRRGEEASSGQA